MRKIVTAKDFEFSPRKESAAAEPASSPSLACACIMHAQRRCEKNVLAAAKRGMPCLVSMYAALPAQYTICRCTCVDTGGSRCTQLRRRSSNYADKISLIMTSIMNDVNGEWQYSV